MKTALTKEDGKFFGGRSVIMIGDPQQLKPVCDKPLYEKPDPKNVTPLGLM